jgi:hypothetical protein
VQGRRASVGRVGVAIDANDDSPVSIAR